MAVIDLQADQRLTQAERTIYKCQLRSPLFTRRMLRSGLEQNPRVRDMCPAQGEGPRVLAVQVSLQAPLPRKYAFTPHIIRTMVIHLYPNGRVEEKRIRQRWRERLDPR